MLSNIISAIIAHKAALMLGTAAVGVVSTAVVATKDKDKYVDNVYDEVANLEDEEISEEVLEALTDDVNVLPYGTVKEAYKKCVSKKRRAIIFLKSYWRTGLLIFLTVALMLLSHISMAKELAATAAALGIATSKYNELKDALKEKYPDTYQKIEQYLNEKNIRKGFSEKESLVEGTYDGRDKYFEPWSCQIFFAKEAEVKDAECTINERIMNTGGATLFDYLATFPSSSGIKLESWMKHFGWWEGDTTYSYNAGYMGSYLKPEITKQNIIFKGDKEEVYSISWNNNADIEPDLPATAVDRIDRIMALKVKEMKKKPRKDKIA